MRKIKKLNKNRYLLDIKKGKCHRLPKVVTVLAGNFEVLVEFLLYQWIVLHRDRVPHEIFLQNKIVSTHASQTTYPRVLFLT